MSKPEKKKFKIVELFSGIGSQAKAISILSKKLDFTYEIISTCEWNVHAIIAYNFIHKSPKLLSAVSKMDKDSLVKALEKYELSHDGKTPISKTTLNSYNLDNLRQLYSSILKTNNLVSIKDIKASSLPNDIDLMTYSFPCQDLSNVGAFHGYTKGIKKGQNTRSGLLWEVGRILHDRKKAALNMPKFLLLENVAALESKKNKPDFEEWKQTLDGLGYVNKVFVTNSLKFGVPQNRKRLVMLSVFVGKDERLRAKVFEQITNFDIESSALLSRLGLYKKKLKNYLRLDYSIPKYFNEALDSQPNNTKSRLTIWNQNSQILNEKGDMKELVQTITTKQDRHPNSGNLYFNPSNAKSQYRFLTPRECFLLMGFSEKDYEKIVENNFLSRANSLFFSRDVMYKLAGNSIVVDILVAIFALIMELNSDSDLFNVRNDN